MSALLQDAVRDLLHDGNPVQRLNALAAAHPDTWGRLDPAPPINQETDR